MTKIQNKSSSTFLVWGSFPYKSQNTKTPFPSIKFEFERGIKQAVCGY